MTQVIERQHLDRARRSEAQSRAARATAFEIRDGSPRPPASPPRRRTVRIALLGCGTVGGEIARQLAAPSARDRFGDDVVIELSHILIRDPSRERDVDRRLLTTEFREILDSHPDVVIEALGGIEPAFEFVAAALRRGIPVVTANKSLMARKGPQLRALAEHHGTAIFCEAQKLSRSTSSSSRCLSAGTGVIRNPEGAHPKDARLSIAAASKTL